MVPRAFRGPRETLEGLSYSDDNGEFHHNHSYLMLFYGLKGLVRKSSGGFNQPKKWTLIFISTTIIYYSTNSKDHGELRRVGVLGSARVRTLDDRSVVSALNIITNRGKPKDSKAAGNSLLRPQALFMPLVSVLTR